MKMLIIDNSPETRNHLLGLVQELDGIDVVGMANDAETGMLLAKAHRPNLAIVNLPFETEGTIDMIQGIKDADPKSNVVALAERPSLENRFDALAAGSDYLMDNADELDRLAGLLRLLNNLHSQSGLPH